MTLITHHKLSGRTRVLWGAMSEVRAFAQSSYYPFISFLALLLFAASCRGN